MPEGRLKNVPESPGDAAAPPAAPDGCRRYPAPSMTDHTSARSTFIIATRNRPDELLTTVESLVAQTLLPKDLCIVDSSDETPVRDKIEELCEGVCLPLDYHHPAPRGLTVQRNFGVARTDGDPVFFIDDDVFLAPDCHEAVLAEYERWGPELGGVRATPVHPARPPLRKSVV